VISKQPARKKAHDAGKDVADERAPKSSAHLSPRLAFKFHSGAMGNPAAVLCGPFVGGQAHRRLSLRNLKRGKLGQGREDELRLSDLLAGVSYG